MQATESRFELNEPVGWLIRPKRPKRMVRTAGRHRLRGHRTDGGKEIGSLVMMRAGRLDGIVSERDYARKVILKGKHSRETPAVRRINLNVHQSSTRSTNGQMF